MKMNSNKLITLILLLFFALPIYGQDKTGKINSIIDSLGLVETVKSRFDWTLESLRNAAAGSDSVKLVELEKQLDVKKIRIKLIAGIDEMFEENEINDICSFIQTSTFRKIKSGEIIEYLFDKFNYIDHEIKRIHESIYKKEEGVADHNKYRFEPIPVDREDGFYATVDYEWSIYDKDIVLEASPSLTKKDILTVEKTKSRFSSYEMTITLTKEAAVKFYQLTNDNISKPIAVVIDKHIIFLPRVNVAIEGGKLTMSGDFSEAKIDKYIEKLKK